MTLLIGATTIGLILALLAMGVYLSFRIFNFPDITADGSITLGAAVTATLLVKSVSPALATLAGFAAGMLAGMTTGVLHTKFKINGLLSGILVMTALYSVNLHVMGKSNVPLLNESTLNSELESLCSELVSRRFRTRCARLDSRAARCRHAAGHAWLWLVASAWRSTCFFRPTSARPCAPPAITPR